MRSNAYASLSALEQAVREQFLELGDESTLLGAARQAKLDADCFQADWHDPKLAQAAQHSHEQAVGKWNVSGTPTLILGDEHSLHLELAEIPSEADALETFQAIETLALRLPYVRQLRQTNQDIYLHSFSRA